MEKLIFRKFSRFCFVLVGVMSRLFAYNATVLSWNHVDVYLFFVIVFSAKLANIKLG